MPVSLLNADTMFPSFTEDTPSSEKIDVVMNYLYMLLEELRYTFGNLGTENFNDASLDELSIQLTKPVYGKIEDIEGNVNELKLTSTGLNAKISSVDGRVTSLSATVDGLETTVQGYDGAISTISHAVGSIRLEVTNGTTSSKFKLTNDFAELSSGEIRITGMVTFADLESDDTTVINGAYIKTGTIESSTVAASNVYSSIFATLLTGESAGGGSWDGEIRFYYRNFSDSNIAGGIRLDDLGANSTFEAPYRLFVYTQNIGSGSSKRSFALKLKSEYKISVEAEDFLYLYGDNITINANQGTGEINLFGAVYINGRLIS